MARFDWIVVGSGLTGAALAYELARTGLSVLLLDRSPDPASATRYSYGGAPFWAQRTPLIQAIGNLSCDRYAALPEETGVDIEWRDLDLLLTVSPDQDPAALLSAYAGCRQVPLTLSVADAIALEPQLNPAALGGALRVPQPQVNPMAVVRAYTQGLQALGGEYRIATVTGLVQVGDRVTGVLTPSQAYAAGQVAIAAGSHSLALVQSLGISLPLYFTHAEILETPPLSLTLRPLIMPALLSRSALERQASQPEAAALWDGAQADQALPEPILDPGLIQFRDGHCCLGQISYIQPDSDTTLNPAHSEAQLRDRLSTLIPALAGVPGTWRHCTVPFSPDGLPFVGAVPGRSGLSLFTGFSGPFALVPGLARAVALAATGQGGEIDLEPLSPGRFSQYTLGKNLAGSPLPRP